MTVCDLESRYYNHNPFGHFFDKETLEFFGETRSTMKVLPHTEIIKDCMGETHTCYVLSKLQRKYPGGSRRTVSYFDTATYDVVIPGRNK